MPTLKVIKKIYNFLEQSNTKNVIIYGGAGAGKSYTVAQFLILERILKYPNKHILVTRKTNPSLRLSAYRLILNLLDELQIPYEHHKAEQIISFPYRRSQIIFRGMDDPEKIKSAEFNYIWMEEATEFHERDYQQLRLRLRRANAGQRNQIYLTFNPISMTNWIYPFFFEQQQPDTAILRVTYKDNPFLDPEYKAILENLKHQDRTFYKIYTLGEFAQFENVVYENWQVVHDLPNYFDEYIYGLDFGYNNPTACIKIGLKDDEVWIVDEIYQTRLTQDDLIERLRTFIEPATAPIYCDPSEPSRIEELYRAGFNAYPANRKVTVKAGIDFVKRQRIYIHQTCVNTIKELKNYKWREDKDGNVLDEPVKFMDHCYDEQTEILTEYGWKPFKDLQPDDKVATRNSQGWIEFHRPMKYIKTYYQGPLYVYESNNVNFAVTPNHRMYVANQYSAKVKKQPVFTLKRVVELPGVSWLLRVGQIRNGVHIDADLAEFVGFWLAEGCKSITRGRKYVHVDNNDREYLEHFQRIFGGSVYKTTHTWRLSIRSDELYDRLPAGKSFEKRIPLEFFKADKESIIALLRGYIKGDGRVNNKGVSADSASKQLVDDLQTLSFMIGLPTNVYQVRDWCYATVPSGNITLCRPMWRVAWSKEQRGTSGLGLVELHKTRIQTIYYEGYVYCVEVPNHVVAVRRNGRVMWSGNSMDAIRYALVTHLYNRQEADVIVL